MKLSKEEEERLNTMDNIPTEMLDRTQREMIEEQKLKLKTVQENNLNELNSLLQSKVYSAMLNKAEQCMNICRGNTHCQTKCLRKHHQIASLYTISLNEFLTKYYEEHQHLENLYESPDLYNYQNEKI